MSSLFAAMCTTSIPSLDLFYFVLSLFISSPYLSLVARLLPSFVSHRYIFGWCSHRCTLNIRHLSFIITFCLKNDFLWSSIKLVTWISLKRTFLFIKNKQTSLMLARNSLFKIDQLKTNCRPQNQIISPWLSASSLQELRSTAFGRNGRKAKSWP